MALLLSTLSNMAGSGRDHLVVSGKVTSHLLANIWGKHLKGQDVKERYLLTQSGLSFLQVYLHLSSHCEGVLLCLDLLPA